MMPDRPMPGGPGPMGPGAGGGPSPEEIKSQLVQLLTQAKQMAEQNGVNFDEVIAAVGKGGGKAAPPRPPAPGGPPPMP